LHFGEKFKNEDYKEVVNKSLWPCFPGSLLVKKLPHFTTAKLSQSNNCPSFLARRQKFPGFPQMGSANSNPSKDCQFFLGYS
jgi:hypothetical protein